MAKGGCAEQGIAEQPVALRHKGFAQFQPDRRVIAQIQHIVIERQFLLQGHPRIGVIQLRQENAGAFQAGLAVKTLLLHHPQHGQQ